MTLRLFLLNPATVFAARVNQASFSYALDSVTFDGVTTGAYTDIEVGMTVLFGSTAGADDLGRQRVRKTPTSSVLYIGRSSRGIGDGEVNLSDNAHITVVNDRRVWSKIPHIDSDGVSYKDSDLAVGDNTENIPPVANIGPGGGFAATIDGSNIITADLVGTASFANSGSISTYLWDVDDGTITTGTSASSAITATFPAGFRYVSLTVTDSNGNTHTQTYPVFARDPASDATISAFQIDAHRIAPQGQQLSIRVLEDIPSTTYPDGTLVMVMDGEPANDLDRDHMLFIGWLHNDPAEFVGERTGLLRGTVLECLDVGGKMDTIPAFPQSVEGKSSPAAWSEMASPNMDKYLHYLLHWHSTALDVAYWTNTGTGSAFPFVILGSDGESLWDQVARRSMALVPDYLFTCNRRGQLRHIIDPLLEDTGDRTAVVQATLQEAGWTSIQYTRTRPPRYHWHRGNAILAHASTISALFCVAPGDTPGQGPASNTQGEQLAQSQADLNACEGHRYARLNKPLSLFTITLAAGDDQDIEPADLAWVRLNISADTAAQRGLTFANARGLPMELNISYEHTRTGLVRTVELLWEPESDGVPATTYIQPDDETEYDDWDVPVPDIPPPDETPGQGDGYGTVYGLVAATLGRTRSLSAGSPAWLDVGPTDANAHADFIIDPWNPLTGGYLSGVSGLYRTDELLLASPSWNLVLTNAEVVTDLSATSVDSMTHVLASINYEDYVATFFIAEVSGSRNLYCAYSNDAGANWSYGLIWTGPTSEASSNYIRTAHFDYVPHSVSGDIVIYAALAVQGNPANRNNQFMLRSGDRGANWTNQGQIPSSGPLSGQGALVQSVHCPYDGNESGNLVYVAMNGSTGIDGIHYSANSGVDFTLLTGASSAIVHRFAVGTWTFDNQQVAYWQGNTLRISTDGYATSNAAGMTGYSGTIGGAGGFPYENERQYAISTDGIFVSDDKGDNWTDKTGDWAFGFTTPRVIVPVWVEE